MDPNGTGILDFVSALSILRLFNSGQFGMKLLGHNPNLWFRASPSNWKTYKFIFFFEKENLQVYFYMFTLKNFLSFLNVHAPLIGLSDYSIWAHSG